MWRTMPQFLCANADRKRMADTTLARAQQTLDPAYGQGNPDPRALELAGALQQHLPEADVLLFGSRAIRRLAATIRH